MTVVRIDLDSKEDPQTGWQWENVNGDIESIVVCGSDLLRFLRDEEELCEIDRSEIKYWLKALTEAEKYFDENH